MPYGPPHASPLVTFAMGGLAVGLAGLFVLAVLRSGLGRRGAVLAAAGSAAWLGLTGALAGAGVLARFDARPPPFLVLVVVLLGLALAVAFSPVGDALVDATPLAALVGFQGFRLPLEMVMHRAAGEGVMPVEMSFGGYNFDILTGITAILLGGVIARAAGTPAERSPPLRAIVLGWNVLGLGFLTVVVGIALAASPMLRAFGDDAAHVNSWVAYPPFVWLPAVMVFAALLGHVLTLRKVLRGARTSLPVAHAPDGQRAF